MTEYVPLEDCDIQDKQKLAVYRYLRSGWIEILNGKDEHAITQQITELLSAELEYRTIRRARQLSHDTSVSQNGMVHRFVDQGFIAHQVLAIRRLVEQYEGGPRRRAVYSLPRIISDLEEHRELISREMFICFNGTPYDGVEHIGHPGPCHEAFDELARTKPESRIRQDLIHPDFFGDLRNRLKKLQVFQTFANKVLAHGADPTTRKRTEQFEYSDLQVAYKELASIANTLSADVLYDSHHEFLPHYAVDPLEHIDNPICPTSQIESLRLFWKKHQEDLRQLERGEDT